MDPVYKMERQRLLENIMCNKLLERRGFDTHPRGWHEVGSRCIQRQIAELRNRWSASRSDYLYDRMREGV